MPNNYLSRAKKSKDRKKLKSIRRKQKSSNTALSFNNDEVNSFFFQPGIYFLKQDDNIVYIGETISLMQRVSQHINDATKVFNNFSFDKCSGSDKERKSIEDKLIRKHKPQYNVVHKKVKVSDEIRC